MRKMSEAKDDKSRRRAGRRRFYRFAMTSNCSNEGISKRIDITTTVYLPFRSLLRTWPR